MKENNIFFFSDRKENDLEDRISSQIGINIEVERLTEESAK